MTVNKCDKDMVYIPEGSFQMGPPEKQKKVNVSGFCIDKTEFTNGDGFHTARKSAKEFRAIIEPCEIGKKSMVVMGNDPKKLYKELKGKVDGENTCVLRIVPIVDSRFDHKAPKTESVNHPAQVTWNKASSFCEAQGKRLPTEAEWEKAAKGPETRPYATQEGVLNELTARWDSDKPVPVKSYNSNSYGLFDMTGNVPEWTNDWYNKHAYNNMEPKDPQGPPEGYEKVVRGGSWSDRDPSKLKTFSRFSLEPHQTAGFRCVKSPKS